MAFLCNVDNCSLHASHPPARLLDAHAQLRCSSQPSRGLATTGDAAFIGFWDCLARMTHCRNAFLVIPPVNTAFSCRRQTPITLSCPACNSALRLWPKKG